MILAMLRDPHEGHALRLPRGVALEAGFAPSRSEVVILSPSEVDEGMVAESGVMTLGVARERALLLQVTALY